MAEGNAPGFRLPSDFYHMQLEERDIAATLRVSFAKTTSG
jgi:hypothetical protein